jgi:hypothetical protein
MSNKNHYNVELNTNIPITIIDNRRNTSNIVLIGMSDTPALDTILLALGAGDATSTARLADGIHQGDQAFLHLRTKSLHD